MKFVKKGDLELQNGGYLTIGKETPVTNDAFVTAQEEAHYLVSLAAEVSKASFTSKTADSFDAIVAKVSATLKNNQRSYVDAPKQPARKITDALKGEAMDWIKFEAGKTSTERINGMLQKFNVLQDFEEFGLYFTEGITKLENLYSVSEITEAITTLEPHID